MEVPFQKHLLGGCHHDAGTLVATTALDTPIVALDKGVWALAGRPLSAGEPWALPLLFLNRLYSVPLSSYLVSEVQMSSLDTLPNLYCHLFPDSRSYSVAYSASPVDIQEKTQGNLSKIERLFLCSSSLHLVVIISVLSLLSSFPYISYSIH